MKRYTSLISCALMLAGGLTGCKNDDITPAVGGLAGTWQLADRQCFCRPTPLPDETIVFTATDFTQYENGTLTNQGTYTIGTPTLCGLAASAPGLIFQITTPASHSYGATYSIVGDKLILDYGSPCDGPRNTYTRKAPQKRP
ncbi:hypothetical protein [Hymenobacter lapidiphilus]|uniref:Lipocalin-like domain-containing protein n=1 Tax=Hymenobacter lapidiphilus TaxID=2608003 RepID=A0A7Y7PME6_9BACT|nr:hypothetical protein [Hymenobacter lapidiphilus]NVO30425.1 hypothetical protein [Hymenobacter lapidiphilus]